jgi:hypothetical protein
VGGGVGRGSSSGGAAGLGPKGAAQPRFYLLRGKTGLFSGRLVPAEREDASKVGKLGDSRDLKSRLPEGLSFL